jgi:hypothetical protein
VLYLATELVAFVVGSVYHLDLGWVRSAQERRDEVRTEFEGRPGQVLQIHPYVGYVETPPSAVGGDSSGRLSTFKVTPYGYVDRVSPIQTRASGKVIVGITGGSVAWSFHMFGTDRLRALLQNDPALAGKEIVFPNLAVSGYKQPQQLMTLNYLLVLGSQFDMIVNIDGFNEAALYEAENAWKHVFPAFPRKWSTRVEVAGPRLGRYWGGIELEAEHRLDAARLFSRRPLRYSSLANLTWIVVDSRAETALLVLQDEYLKAPKPAANYAVEGPGWTFASRRDLYRHLVALWKNSSLQLGRLCAANGIRYYHFLQPNLLIAGSKPLTTPEAQMARDRDQRYRPGVEEAYPLMIKEGRDLRAQGERFTDLTQIFAAHPEGIYVDLCHVNQTGNDLLADRIAEAILAEARADHSS